MYVHIYCRDRRIRQEGRFYWNESKSGTLGYLECCLYMYIYDFECSTHGASTVVGASSASVKRSTFWGKASDGLNFHQNQWNHFPWLHQMIDPPEVSYFNSPWKLAVGWKEDRLVVDWNLCYFYPYLGKWSILTSAIFFWVESTNDRDDPTF